MKSVILVVICIFSCQAIPLNGSEPVLINNQTERIPEATTESPQNSTNVSPKGQNGLRMIGAGSVVYPTEGSTNTSESPITSAFPTTSTSSITSASPTTATPTTPAKPSTTGKPPNTTSSSTTLPSSKSPPITTTSISPTTGPTIPSTKAPTSRPSTQPVASTTPAVPTNRGFDGPSFIGGIVLAAGLMAIGFVAFKFYKARTELNYHTL